MSKEYMHILKSAMTLPRKEQFALIQAILQRIEDTEATHNPSERAPWETEDFFRELDRRVEEIRSGKVKPIPGEEVMAKLKKRIG